MSAPGRIAIVTAVAATIVVAAGMGAPANAQVSSTTSTTIAPTLSLKPSAGPVNTTFTASGVGYASCDVTWYVAWDGGEPSSTPQSATSDFRSGQLTVPPDAAPGRHTVTAYCRNRGSEGPLYARKSATFTVIVPTTVAPTTATTRPTTTTPTGRTTTTRRGTTTPVGQSTTTTAPAPTIPGQTTTTELPSPFSTTGPATLRAINFAGAPSGRPGAGLRLSGDGYTGCAHVHLFMGNQRLGMATPTGDRIDTDQLSVPGDAPVGSLPVTSSCQLGGKPLRASTIFTVLGDKLHRAAMFTAMPHPGTISLDGARLAFSAGVAIVIFVLLLFPFQLFNSTLAENYEEVRGWFGMKPHAPGYVPNHHGKLLVPLMVVTGLLYTLATPDFAFNQSTLLAGIGLSIGVTIVGLAFIAPGLLFARRRLGEWGRVRILPASIPVAAATVLLSRIVGFLPGYLYGLLVVLSLRRDLDPDDQGRIGALTTVLMFALTIGAWLALSPVAHAAAEPHAGAASLIAEAALGGIFLLGLESVIVDLLPMKFMTGSRIRAWRQAVWAVLFGFAIFSLVHILLAPESGYVGSTPQHSMWRLGVILLVGFGAGSLAFWAYFRYRRPPTTPAPTGASG